MSRSAQNEVAPVQLSISSGGSIGRCHPPIQVRGVPQILLCWTCWVLVAEHSEEQAGAVFELADDVNDLGGRLVPDALAQARSSGDPGRCAGGPGGARGNH
jgi:hypothetical protein